MKKNYILLLLIIIVGVFIMTSIGFIYQKVSELTKDTPQNVEFRMRIPLGAVFECFDNCDNFSTNESVIVSASS